MKPTMNLRQLRKAAQLTSEQAISELNISQSLLGKLETGHKEPSKKTILDMARVYKTTTDEIFTAVEATKRDKEIRMEQRGAFLGSENNSRPKNVRGNKQGKSA